MFQERKNSTKRTQLAEQAEVQATEKINDIKTEQWAIIERLKAEKREIEARVSTTDYKGATVLS